MLKTNPLQISFYLSLYHKIPKNHILKVINFSISLNFVNSALKDSYCVHFGRPAKEPEMMIRILLLGKLYNLADVPLINEINVNLAFMEFIGINPEDEAPSPSLLSKFRTMRISDVFLDDIMIEIIRQCIEKHIITEDCGLSIDATHIEANTVKKVPERIMKHLAKNIFSEAGVEEHDIPDYTDIEDHNEAKQVMKEMLEKTIDECKDKAPESVAEAEEILKSDLFIEQRGIRSLVDKDARVGNKSKTKQFFGYKAEFTMTTGSNLITAVTVNQGNYVDGTKYKDLYDNTVKSGL